MAQAQEHAEPSREEAEGIVASGLAELPEVAAAYYTAQGDRWNLTVLHDYGSVEEGVAWVTGKMLEVRKKLPRLDIRPMILPASNVPDSDRAHDTVIYER